MEDGGNGVASTIALIAIQTRNVASKRATLNVRIVLLFLMVKNVKSMKCLLYTAQPLTVNRVL